MPNTPPLNIIPANEASWEDLTAIFSGRGDHRGCWCQRFRTASREWYKDAFSAQLRPDRLRAQTRCGDRDAETTSGLVAFRDETPVGWCAVAPRSDYLRLGQTPWRCRSEAKDDNTIWAATCFIVRREYRRQRISYDLARGAVDHARKCGARALEGYPMITTPGEEITWGELHVGSRNIFAAAGFTEVSRPSKRRVVMRIESHSPWSNDA